MEDILNYIKNYFAVSREEALFEVNNNSIKVKGKYLAGQYIRIEGSILNDGIYKIESIEDDLILFHYNLELNNEEFKGNIYGLSIPKNIISIAKKYEELKKEANSGIYESENFDSYSYTIAKDNDGAIYNTLDSFKKELKKYRQMKDISIRKARVI